MLKNEIDDEIFMEEAFIEAEKAFGKGEVPVGAVLVHKGEVIARGHNLVETACCASRHAELICLEKGAEALHNWRLLGCTLYSTLEPCPMCAGAMFSFRIERLVWGAPDLRMGANGSFIDLFAEKHPMHKIAVTSGIFRERSSSLLQQFFRERR